MNNWKETTLDSAAEIIKDSWKPGDDFSKYIGLEHINENSLTLNGIGNSEELKSNKFKFKSGDILFGKLRPYFRKVVMPNFDGVCSTDVWVVKTREGFDQKYLFYFMANPVFIDKSMGANTGTHMPRADWNFLKNTRWKFPPIEQQKQIAVVLSSLDDKIELLRAENETLEKIAQGIFKEWFVNFRIDGKKLKLKNDVPEGWRMGKLGEIASLKSGFAFRGEDFVEKSTTRVLKIKDLKGGGEVDLANMSFVNDDVVDQERVKYFKLNFGDIVLAMSGNTTGKIGIIPAYLDNLFLNQRVGKFFMKNNDYKNLLYLFLMSGDYETVILNMGYGSAQPNINPAQIGNIDMIFPEKCILVKFKSVIDLMMEKVLINKSQIQGLSQLRDTLLPKLMSGEIEFSKNE